MAATIAGGVAFFAPADPADARSNGGGPRPSMGSAGSMKSGGAGVRAPTTGTKKGEPNPISRDHRQPNSMSGGGVTVTSGPPRPKKRETLCAGWGCPKPRQPNKETVVNDHRSGR